MRVDASNIDQRFNNNGLGKTNKYRHSRSFIYREWDVFYLYPFLFSICHLCSLLISLFTLLNSFRSYRTIICLCLHCYSPSLFLFVYFVLKEGKYYKVQITKQNTQPSSWSQDSAKHDQLCSLDPIVTCKRDVNVILNYILDSPAYVL